MQPDKASAVTAAMIGSRNARATRTGAIPSHETAQVLHWLWLTKGFRGCGGRPLVDRPQLVRGRLPCVGARLGIAGLPLYPFVCVAARNKISDRGMSVRSARLLAPRQPPSAKRSMM